MGARASTQNPAATTKYTQPENLLYTCNTFPQMTGLVIKFVEPRMRPLFLKPLSNCSHLAYLRVEHNQQYECWGWGLDLGHLPETLRTLDLVDVAVDPATIERLNLPLLTKLYITDFSLSLRSIKQLLHRLPALEEMEVKDQAEMKFWRHVTRKVGQMWGSSQHLTRLKLDVRAIGENKPQDLVAPNLRSLHLCGELLEAEWLNDLFQRLPGLTCLTLSGCQIHDLQEIAPALQDILRRD